MTARHFFSKTTFLLFLFIVFSLTISLSVLDAAENTITMDQITTGAGSLTQQQIQQLIQNATPEQLQQVLEQIPGKQRVAPYETIYREKKSKEEPIKKPEEMIPPETKAHEEVEPKISYDQQVTPEEKRFSSIEQLYQQKYGTTLAETLEQYGYTIFETSTDTLSKLAVPGDDYLIGPGDTLRIRLWGSNIDGAYSVIVSRDGTIDAPQIGILPVAGTPLGKLEEVIRSEAEKYVQGININVSLEELRSIEVYVVGEVNQPGLHLVPPFSTVINALITGQGVKKTGSLRKIKLFRNGTLYQVVDLYSLFLHGSRKTDITLQDGDVLFVPRLGATAAVAGAIIQPAIYELTTESSVADLLELAGGTLPQTSKDRLYLRRFDENQQFVVLDIGRKTSISDLGTIAIRNGDLLELRYLEPLRPQVVYLAGNVWVPDIFNYRPNIKLSDILNDISILKPNSITDFALLYRYDATTTRYGVERFPLADVFSGKFDADLNPYDKIEILSRDEYGIKEPVKIVGSVWRPDDYVYTPGLTLGDILGLSGGFKFDADPQRIDLSRQNIDGGEVTTSHFTLQADADAAFLLQPYDYIYVRQIKDAASFKSVTITGEVKFPGQYRIKDGETLSDLIERAGGFTEEAYFYGAYFASSNAREIQQESIDRMVDDLELRVQNVIAEQSQLDQNIVSGQQAALQKLVARLRQVEATGRMSITLGPLASLKDTPFDFKLQKGDSLHIPQRPNFVSVVGSVYSPNSFMFKTDMTLAEYLEKAGGPTKTADDDSIYVIKANGEILASAQNKGMFNDFKDTRLMPGDTIVVPEDLERVPAFKVIQDVSDIIFKIATTAGIAFAI